MTVRLAKSRDAARAAWWTLSAIRQARRRLRDRGLAGFALTPPPASLQAGERGMWLVLGRLRPSCLERALVLQAWLAAHGRTHDVVVGIRKADQDFSAHAWIDAEESWQRGEFREIARFTPVRS